MANIAIKKILFFEKIYNSKKSTKNCLAMALRYYLGYVVSRQKDFLHKANFVLTSQSFSSDINTVFMQAHIASELGNLDMVEDLTDKLKPYRNAMRSGDSAMFARYIYFNCIVAIGKEKERAANKHYRALEAYCSEHRPACGPVLLAAANYHFKEYGDALDYLHRAYKNGDRSPFFYACLGLCLEKTVPKSSRAELLLPFIRWGITSGYHLNAIVDRNKQHSEDILRRNPVDAENLYRVHPMDWILHIVCTRRMINNDLSESAFYFYKDAETRQLHFPQLYDFLLRAAYKNGIEDISRYSLAQYLKMGEGFAGNYSEIPAEILPFAYHLLLKASKDGQNEESLARSKPDMLRFASYALENRLYGRYYYSLYRYLLELHISGDKILGKAVESAEDIIKNLMFTYEISFDNINIKKVLIQEEHRRSEALRDVRGNKLRANLCEGNFKITCFDETMRNIIECRPKIQKLVENVDIRLLEYFFSKGQADTEIIVALASHYMNTAYSEMSQNAVSVYEKTASSDHIAVSFKMQVRVALGNYYGAHKAFDRAMEYYKDIDESKIDPKYLEQILYTYIQTGEIDRAAHLIAHRGEHILDKNLFHAIKRISIGHKETKWAKSLAWLGYEQLTRGWYDKGLLDMVLEHHTAGLNDWTALAKSLSAIGVVEVALYTKILTRSIEICNPGKDIQVIFVKMEEAEPGADILTDFALYLTYEIIINGLVPEYGSIYAMERMFSKYRDNFIAYGLAHVYIQNSIATAKSGEILRLAVDAAMKDNILWPIFKDIKDKQLILPYIEENAPFSYRARNVSEGIVLSFHYRVDNLGEFVSVPMKYLRFGLYICHVPHFYGEELEYYFQEAIETGSVTTTPAKIFNNRPHILENTDDLYYIINSALIYEQMFKYDNVEEIVTGRLAEKPSARAKIM